MTTGNSSERHYIHWTCGANEWSMSADSVWTIFYGSNRFYTDGQRVEVSEYLTPNSRRVYWASETANGRYQRASAGLMMSDSTCAMWSDLIDRDTSVVRIYRGEIKWLYRGDADHSQYALIENEESCRIAYVRDSLVVHRDFDYWFDRDPHPTALGDARAYYPFNFSQTAIDTMPNVPEDDRPYLLDVVCAGDDCPEFLRPTATRTTVRSAGGGGGDDSYIGVQSSEEAESLPQVAIDCSSVSVPQEVLDARDLVDELQGPRDQNNAAWVRAVNALVESHGIEQLKECLIPLSYDPHTYSYDPPCTEHNEAYVAHKETDDLLYAAQVALRELEEEHGIPPACR
ncbi:MAG: hypothetical protein F4X17_20200 [Gemmatimonadetes bacterium]|nr:hypothetical protein [Gemmatimonadota bacterium]